MKTLEVREAFHPTSKWFPTSMSVYFNTSASRTRRYLYGNGRLNRLTVSSWRRFSRSHHSSRPNRGNTARKVMEERNLLLCGSTTSDEKGYAFRRSLGRRNSDYSIEKPSVPKYILFRD